jgi:hypothetical protein
VPLSDGALRVADGDVLPAFTLVLQHDAPLCGRLALEVQTSGTVQLRPPAGTTQIYASDALEWSGAGTVAVSFAGATLRLTAP